MSFVAATGTQFRISGTHALLGFNARVGSLIRLHGSFGVHIWYIPWVFTLSSATPANLLMASMRVVRPPASVSANALTSGRS